MSVPVSQTLTHSDHCFTVYMERHPDSLVNETLVMDVLVTGHFGNTV